MQIDAIHAGLECGLFSGKMPDVDMASIGPDMADVHTLLGDMPGHYILRNPRKTTERWDGDEHSLNEMIELLKEALQFNQRTQGSERIIELGYTNEQVAEQLMKIYKSLV